MDNYDFCHLFVVMHNDKLYMVEAPSYETDVGDLVEFAPTPELVLGEVVDKMFCSTDSDEYRCIRKLVPVYLAQRIYKVHWKALEEENEDSSGGYLGT